LFFQQLYCHIENALGCVLKNVSAELTEQFFAVNSDLQGSWLAVNRAVSSSAESVVESNSWRWGTESGPIRRSSGTLLHTETNQTTASEARTLDYWRAFKSAVGIEATSKLNVSLQPIIEFIIQRLVSLNLWLCDSDFQRVRNALCMQLAEVSVPLILCRF